MSRTSFSLSDVFMEIPELFWMRKLEWDEPASRLCDYNATSESCKIQLVFIGKTWMDRSAAATTYLQFMASAMHAAPKPLSMLTTATPGAQLFNMPSRAAMPPKLAP